MNNIIVTEHAIDRYAQRVMEIDPDTLTDRNRNDIAHLIRSTVAPRVCAGVSRLHACNAVFLLDGTTVVTVKHRKRPSNWRTYKGLCRRPLRGDRA